MSGSAVNKKQSAFNKKEKSIGSVLACWDSHYKMSQIKV